MFFVYEDFLFLRMYSEIYNNFISFIKGWYFVYFYCFVLWFFIKGWIIISFSMNIVRMFFIMMRKIIIYLKVFIIWWIVNFWVIYVKIIFYMFCEFRKDINNLWKLKRNNYYIVVNFGKW